MSVTLRKRKNSDGTISLILDIYNNGNRRYEFLKHLKLCKPKNPADRQSNKDKLQQAEKIAVKKAAELSANDYSMVSDTGRKTLVVEWMQSFINSYKKKDKRNMQGALNNFKDFLIEDRKQDLTFGQLTELIISDYQDYLRDRYTGEGPASYFNRFKKMVRQAFREKLIAANPAAGVKTIQGHAKKKDILTIAEIQTLANTNTENDHVKRAFLFSCVTGLRWVDVKALKWSNINLEAGQITLKQSKTEKEIRNNLNRTAIKLLGKQKGPDQLVFILPTANGANKTLAAWVKRAKIKKEITWHNARHSFGTNIIFHGADLITASALLGHASVKHTQRYITAANELKERATDKLNIEL